MTMSFCNKISPGNSHLGLFMEYYIGVDSSFINCILDPYEIILTLKRSLRLVKY